MSSTTLTTTVPATRLRITARGRRVLAALVALPVAAGIAFAVLSGGSALASGEATTANTFEKVTVLPGDTLWSIAAEVAPNADPRDAVVEIGRLNGVHDGDLSVGQVLAIPTQYTAAK